MNTRSFLCKENLMWVDDGFDSEKYHRNQIHYKLFTYRRHSFEMRLEWKVDIKKRFREDKSHL